MSLKVRILPSLLAADFGSLREEALRAEEAGADGLHLDIMDGHFVPNLSMGPDVVAMAKDCLEMPLSVHLMLSRPDRFVEAFAKAGADSLSIHVEADCDAGEVLARIRELDVLAGVTLNPETPADMVLPLLPDADFVLCMTVHPGHGGQGFISDVLPKIRVIRDELDAADRDADILVDGGIDVETAGFCAGRGANVFVAGTSLYRADDMTAEIDRMRHSAVSDLQ